MEQILSNVKCSDVELRICLLLLAPESLGPRLYLNIKQLLSNYVGSCLLKSKKLSPKFVKLSGNLVSLKVF